MVRPLVSQEHRAPSIFCCRGPWRYLLFFFFQDCSFNSSFPRNATQYPCNKLPLFFISWLALFYVAYNQRNLLNTDIYVVYNVSLSFAELLGLPLYFHPCSYLIFPIFLEVEFLDQRAPIYACFLWCTLPAWYLVGLLIYIPTSNCMSKPAALHHHTGDWYSAFNFCKFCRGIIVW